MTKEITIEVSNNDVGREVSNAIVEKAYEMRKDDDGNSDIALELLKIGHEMYEECYSMEYTKK